MNKPLISAVAGICTGIALAYCAMQYVEPVDTSRRVASIKRTVAKAILPARLRVTTGQVWRYEMFKDNPFREAVTKHYEVLSVQAGYVQYNDIDTDSVYSKDATWFVAGAELVGEGSK